MKSRRRRTKRRSKKKFSRRRRGPSYNGNVLYKFINTDTVTVNNFGGTLIAGVAFNWGGNGTPSDGTPSTALNSNAAFNGIVATYAYYKIVGLKIEYYPYTNVSIANPIAANIVQTSRTAFWSNVTNLLGLSTTTYTAKTMAPDFMEQHGGKSFKRYIRVSKYYKKNGQYVEDWIPTGEQYFDTFSYINPLVNGYAANTPVGTWKATYYVKFKGPNFITLG